MTERRKSFMMYADYMEYFNIISNRELGGIIRQLFRYASGEEPDFTNFTKQMQVIFTVIKKRYDKDTENYDKVCKVRADSAKKRWQNKQETGTERKTSYNTSEIEEQSFEMYRDL